MEKDGKYYTLGYILSKKPEFPNIASLPLSLEYETMEECLCEYHAGWAGVFSQGFLEQVYGIYDEDIFSVSQEIGNEDYDPYVVGRDHLCVENVEDVPRDDKVWSMYEGCPLEEVKYATYSYDADYGKQTSGTYLGKTYGLWSVVWTNGEL